jgi:acyl carrier protein
VATVFERIKRIIVEQLVVNEEDIVPSASFVDDLKADSLDLTELVMAMEEEFSTPARRLEIPDEDMARILTIQDAVNYIHNLGIEDA